MQAGKDRIYEFGPFRLYPDQKLLFRGDARLVVDRKALAVLEILVQNKGQLVSKERLLKEAWNDVSVEEGNVNVHISKIRKLLRDERRQAEYIETVHGEGYRFVADVTEKQEQLYPEERPLRRRILSFFALALVAAIVAVIWIWNSGTRKEQGEHGLDTLTSSPEARSRYERGVKYEYEGDDNEALAALDDATKIDRNFTEAYLKAALISDQLGESDQALEYLNQAKNCGAPRNNHLQLQIEALEAKLTEGYSEAVKKYRLLVDAYPNDVDALFYFADLSMESRKGSDEAREALTQCLRLDPTNPSCQFDRMMLYVLNSDFDKAISGYGSLRPVHYPWLDEPFGLALYENGDLDKARDVFRTYSKGTRTHGTANFTTGREWLADIDFFEGKIADASSEIEVLRPSDTQFGASSHYLYLARVEGLLANQEVALTMALKAVSLTNDRDTRVEAASILACAGYPRDTNRLLKLASGQVIDDLLPATEMFIAGCKALSRGDYKNAIEQLQASYDVDDDLSTEFFLARAFIAARQWDRAERFLKDLESSKGRIIADQTDPPIIWPLAQYYLAVVYDESGDREQAINYYTKFLRLWQSGDANLKVLIDAKTRVARLRSSQAVH